MLSFFLSSHLLPWLYLPSGCLCEQEALQWLEGRCIPGTGSDALFWAFWVALMRAVGAVPKSQAASLSLPAATAIPAAQVLAWQETESTADCTSGPWAWL